MSVVNLICHPPPYHLRPHTHPPLHPLVPATSHHPTTSDPSPILHSNPWSLPPPSFLSLLFNLILHGLNFMSHKIIFVSGMVIIPKFLTLSYYNLILFYILHSIQSGLVILVTPIRASPHKNFLKHPIFLHHLPTNHFSGVCLLPPITASA